MADVSAILNRIVQQDPLAAAELFPLVYDELRRLASAQLQHEKSGQTLNATALVHEAYLRLAKNADQDEHWEGRGHFFASAAEAMRRILVENARRKRRLKHGGDQQRVHVDIDRIVAPSSGIDLIALDEAFGRLEQQSAKRAALVKLRFFAGLTMPEAAQALGVSLATAERYWAYARTWLYAELNEAETP